MNEMSETLETGEINVDIWMPVFIGDYLRETLHLSTELHGAYFLMTIHYWSTRGFLPDNDELLATITRLPIERWKEVSGTLKALFHAADGMLVHQRIDKELQDAIGHRQRAHDRGVKGGRASAASRRAKAMGTQVQPELSPSPSPSTSPSQLPAPGSSPTRSKIPASSKEYRQVMSEGYVGEHVQVSALSLGAMASTYPRLHHAEKIIDVLAAFDSTLSTDKAKRRVPERMDAYLSISEERETPLPDYDDDKKDQDEAPF